MKLTEIIDRLSLDVFTSVSDPEADVGGGYVGDLLSNVLASATPGSLWITIQHHANVVAVAQVTGLAAVLIVEGKRPDDAMREQARTSGVVLLGSTDSAFEVAGRLYDLLVTER